MKKKIVIVLGSCLLLLLLYYLVTQLLFTHDRAAHAAQGGEWERASTLLKQVVADDPDNVSALYDAAVASYKTADYQAAADYFTTTIEKTTHNTLKERALFNRGNTHVQQKKLKEAIADYEQALQLDPDDKKARHNLELVKKMLEEEKKEQNKQQDNQKNDKKDASSQDQQRNASHGQNQQQQQSGGKPEQPNTQPSQEQQKCEQDAPEQKNQRADEPSSKKKNNEGDRDSLQAGKQSNTKDAKKRSSNTVKDAWLAKVLDDREQHDAALNKQMIKAQVGNTMAGNDGQNCW